MTDTELADAAQLSSLADETPEGRSIVVLAKTGYGLRERHTGELPHATFVEFTAQTRMSGVDVDGRQVRKGAAGAVNAWISKHGGTTDPKLGEIVDGISASGGTPLVVAESVDGKAACARRHPPQGRGQGRHAGAVRRRCARWASGP